MSKRFVFYEKKGKGYIHDKRHITDTTSNIPKEPHVKHVKQINGGKFKKSKTI